MPAMWFMCKDSAGRARTTGTVPAELPQLRGRNAPGQRVKLGKSTNKRKTPRLELPGAVAFITKKVYISGVRKYFLQV